MQYEISKNDSFSVSTGLRLGKPTAPTVKIETILALFEVIPLPAGGLMQYEISKDESFSVSTEAEEDLHEKPPKPKAIVTKKISETSVSKQPLVIKKEEINLNEPE